MDSMLKTSLVWLHWSFCSMMAGLCSRGSALSLLFWGLPEAIRHSSGKAGLAALCAHSPRMASYVSISATSQPWFLENNKPTGNDGTGCLCGVRLCVQVVCVYMCFRVHVVPLHVCVLVCVLVYVLAYMCVLACECAFMCAHICACMCVPVCVLVYARVCLCPCACLYVRVCLHMCVCVRVCAFGHACACLLCVLVICVHACARLCTCAYLYMCCVCTTPGSAGRAWVCRRGGRASEAARQWAERRPVTERTVNGFPENGQALRTD